MFKHPAAIVAFVVALMGSGIVLQLPAMSGALFGHLFLTVVLVGVGALAIMHYARHRTPEAEGPVDGALSLAAYFFLIGACVLAGSAVSRLFDRADIRESWQPMQAHVDICRPISDYSADMEDRQLYYGAECAFVHRDDAGERKTSLRACCTAKDAKARDWIKDYPRGREVRLYIDPKDPGRISLGGAESPLMWSSAERNAYTAFLFALTGLACWLVARWITRDPGA